MPPHTPNSAAALLHTLGASRARCRSSQVHAADGGQLPFQMRFTFSETPTSSSKSTTVCIARHTVDHSLVQRSSVPARDPREAGSVHTVPRPAISHCCAVIGGLQCLLPTGASRPLRQPASLPRLVLRAASGLSPLHLPARQARLRDYLSPFGAGEGCRWCPQRLVCSPFTVKLSARRKQALLIQC